MYILNSLVKLVVIIGTIASVRSQIFFNFVPYATSDCDGETIGIGHTIKGHYCTQLEGFETIDTYLWEAVIEPRTETISLSQFDASSSCQGTPIAHQLILNGTCIETPNFLNITGQIKGISGQQYSYVTISPVPVYSNDETQVHEFYDSAADGSCELGDYHSSITFSNGLEILDKTSNTMEVWNCKSDRYGYYPTNSTCEYNGSSCSVYKSEISCDINAGKGNKMIYCMGEHSSSQDFNL